MFFGNGDDNDLIIDSDKDIKTYNNTVKNIQSKIKSEDLEINKPHPFVIIFYISFNSLPLVCYFFISKLFSDPLPFEIFTVYILSYINFWFCKNVAGRILVGLKWNRIINDTGYEKMSYECKRNERINSRLDSSTFWLTLLLILLIWMILFSFNILTLHFNDCLICFLPFILQLTNLYCFYKCSDEQKNNLKSFINRANKKSKSNKGMINNV